MVWDAPGEIATESYREYRAFFLRTFARIGFWLMEYSPTHCNTCVLLLTCPQGAFVLAFICVLFKDRRFFSGTTVLVSQYCWNNFTIESDNRLLMYIIYMTNSWRWQGTCPVGQAAPPWDVFLFFVFS